MLKIIDDGPSFLDKKRIDFLLEKYFHVDRCMKYSEKLEGQRIDNDGNVWVGSRSGPKFHVQSLLHEMCHFVEIDRKRCYAYGWGLQVPEIFILIECVLNLRQQKCLNVNFERVHFNGLSRKNFGHVRCLASSLQFSV